jgi:hypothetical protein
VPRQTFPEPTLRQRDVRMHRGARDAQLRRGLVVGAPLLAHQCVGAAAVVRQLGDRLLAELLQLLLVDGGVGLHPRVRAVGELAHVVLVGARPPLVASPLVHRASLRHPGGEPGKTVEIKRRRALADAHETLECDVLSDVARRFGVDVPPRFLPRDGGDLEEQVGFCLGVQRSGDGHSSLQLRSESTRDISPSTYLSAERGGLVIGVKQIAFLLPFVT